MIVDLIRRNFSKIAGLYCRPLFSYFTPKILHVLPVRNYCTTYFLIFSHAPSQRLYTHSFPSISRPNEEFQLPGWAGSARTVGIFHPVMLARVINCALPWDQWTCHLGIVHLYISPPLHTHTLCPAHPPLVCVRTWVVWRPTHAPCRMDWPTYCH